MRPYEEIKQCVESSIEPLQADPFEEYYQGCKLGAGAFGVVYEMARKSDGKKFAMKQTNRDAANDKEKEEKEK